MATKTKNQVIDDLLSGISDLETRLGQMRDVSVSYYLNEEARRHGERVNESTKGTSYSKISYANDGDLDNDQLLTQITDSSWKDYHNIHAADYWQRLHQLVEEVTGILRNTEVAMSNMSGEFRNVVSQTLPRVTIPETLSTLYKDSHLRYSLCPPPGSVFLTDLIDYAMQFVSPVNHTEMTQSHPLTKDRYDIAVAYINLFRNELMKLKDK